MELLPPPSDSPPPDISPTSPSLLTISLHAFSGGLYSSTIRVTGYIKGLAAQILIDGGSTHNFVIPRATRKLKLAI